MVVVGAGGAGRALAFGAVARGAASVVIANRNRQRGEELAAELASSQGAQAEGCGLEEVASGAVTGDVLVNTTSVGMHPKVGGGEVCGVGGLCCFFRGDGAWLVCLWAFWGMCCQGALFCGATPVGQLVHFQRVI